MSRKRKEKASIKRIAKERITILLLRADTIYTEDPELAQRYGQLARKIAMKARIRIPEKCRLRFCLKCKNYLYPGISARVRIKSRGTSRLVYYCTICQESSRSKILSKDA